MIDTQNEKKVTLVVAAFGEVDQEVQNAVKEMQEKGYMLIIFIRRDYEHGRKKQSALLVFEKKQS